MSDSEVREALDRNTAAMDRASKAAYLTFMAAQQAMESKTPTSLVFGSYNFNPFSDASKLAEWVQISPRNNRRRSIKLIVPESEVANLIYLSASDTIVDINAIIAFNNLRSGGVIQAMLAQFFVPLELQSTESIWACSITGSGSTTEKTTHLGWVEEVYSDVSAEPYSTDKRTNTPGGVQKLTPGLMDVDGDVRAMFTREGVR